MLSSIVLGEEIRALQNSLVDYSYQLTQLHQQLASADRQRSTLQAKILSDEIMQQQVSRFNRTLVYSSRKKTIWLIIVGVCNLQPR